MNDRLCKALKASHESASLDFKRELDVSSTAEWCELVKDIMAMANSGGGTIVIGLENDGSPVGRDVTPILALDPADITNRIYKYTDTQFAEFEIHKAEKNGVVVAAFVVSRSLGAPVAFTKPGTYPIEGGRQKTAFSVGSVYFRHGAKSEPGTTADFRDFMEQEIAARREEWLGNIRKVIEAPPGATIAVVAAETPTTLEPDGVPVRLVDDPTASVLGRLHPDISHPYRLIDVMRMVNERLVGQTKVNAFDVQCVRQAHRVDENATFFYRMKFISPRYSDAFADWLVARFSKDAEFFAKARLICQKEKTPSN